MKRATQTLTAFLKTGVMSPAVKIVPAGVDLEVVRAVYERTLTHESQLEWMLRRLDPAHFEVALEVLSTKRRSPAAVAATAARDVAELKELLRKTGQLQVFSSSAALERKRSREFARDPVFVEAVRRIVTLADFTHSYSYEAFLRVLAEDASVDSLDVLLAKVHAALNAKDHTLDQLRTVLSEATPSLALAPVIALLEARAQVRDGALARKDIAAAAKLEAVPDSLTWFSTLTSAEWEIGCVVDCDTEPYFAVHVRELQRPNRLTQFLSTGARENQLKLPVLRHLVDFPAWRDEVFVTLPTTWRVTAFRRAPKGPARKRLKAWLWGGL